MSWAGFDVLDVYLGSDKGALVRAVGPVVWRDHARAEVGLSDLLKGVAGTRRMWPAPRVRLWLSGGLARPFVFEPPVGLKNAAELLKLARARAAQASGLTPPCEVCLSDTTVGHRQLAVVLNGDLHQALVAVASKTGARLISVQPWWARVQYKVLREQPELQALTVVDTDSVTMLAATQSEWVAAQSYVPTPEGPQLQALVVRFLLSSNCAKSQSARVSLDAAAAANGSLVWPWARTQVDEAHA